MKILILGSEGFIGSNAVAYFSGKGYEVYKADIVLKEEPNYLVINTEQADFAALFTGRGFDACINATGAANVQFSFNQPALDYALNVSNVYHILNAIRQYNSGCRFINFSSAAVYGNPVGLPVAETASLQPLSPYGWHKLYSEQVCREFSSYFNVSTVSLRVFSAYGERLRKQLFWDVYQKIVSSTDNVIEVFGTGNESRDFIYILDLLQAVECVLRKAAFKGEVVNVANGEEVTVKEAISTFTQFVDPAVRVKFNGVEKKGDPLNWRADVTMLKGMGFVPEFSIAGGLEKVAGWLKTQ